MTTTIPEPLTLPEVRPMTEDEEAREILRRAAHRLSDPERWTQGAWARDADGNELGEPCEGDGSSWCVGGAIAYEFLMLRCGDVDPDEIGLGDLPPVAMLAPVILGRELNEDEDAGSVVVIWNDDDGMTHDTIVSTLRKAAG